MNRTMNLCLLAVALGLFAVAASIVLDRAPVSGAEAAPLWSQTDWFAGGISAFRAYYNERVGEGYVLVSFAAFHDEKAGENVYVALFGR